LQPPIVRPNTARSKTLEKISIAWEILCRLAFARLGNLKMGRTYQIEPDSMCNPAGLLEATAVLAAP